MSLWRKRQVEESNGETKRIRNLPVPDTGMDTSDLLSSQGDCQPADETQHLHGSGDQSRHNTSRAREVPPDKGT